MKTFNIFDISSQWAEKNNLCFQAEKKTRSTQDLARKDFCTQKELFKLYLADFQTQGRGRYKRTWSNLKQGDALLSTWCFKISFFPSAHLSLALGSLIRHSLLKIFPTLDLSIKIPNDLYLKDRKIGGIIVETEKIKEHIVLIIGIGMNIFSSPASIKNSSFLSEGIDLSEDDWHLFLEYFFSYLKKLIQTKSPYENPFFKKISLEAIESFPIKKQRIEEIF